MKKISIVIPVHNEATNIQPMITALSSIASTEAAAYDFEFIFVNDGSADTTADEITRGATQDTRIKYIEFSRNFSQQAALSAGIDHAGGDAVIMMDADFQHPPTLIPEFLRAWETGAEIVVGVRSKTEDAPLLKRCGTWAFYQLMRLMSDVTFRPMETDFRLIDACVVREFRKFTERERVTRWLIDWLGFRTAYISFVAPSRLSGATNYSYRQLARLAISAVLTQSVLPLRIAGYLGWLITLSSGVLGLFVFIEMLLLGDPLGLDIAGAAMLGLMTTFLVGIVLICLGFMTMYMINIKDEVAGRPRYVIRTTKNL